MRIDPRDYHLLGYQHRDYLHFDIAPPFGLRFSPMMCQNTTSAVTLTYKNLGHSCANYIDDSKGAETPIKLAAAFQALGDYLRCFGLSTSPDKDSPPATLSVILGFLIDTSEITISVTSDRLSELHSRCASLLSATHVSLAVLAWRHVFCPLCTSRTHFDVVTTLHRALRLYRLSKYRPLSRVNCSDLGWWCDFLPYNNGVSIIKTSIGLHHRSFLSTDACNTGAGDYFNWHFFHTPFLSPIRRQFGYDINILELLTIMVTLSPTKKGLKTLKRVLGTATCQKRVY